MEIWEKQNGAWQERGGASLPVAIILAREGSTYQVIACQTPADGAHYWPSIQEIFPSRYHQAIGDRGGQVQDLEEIIRQRLERLDDQ